MTKWGCGDDRADEWNGMEEYYGDSRRKYVMRRLEHAIKRKSRMARTGESIIIREWSNERGWRGNVVVVMVVGGGEGNKSRKLVTR